MSVTSTTSKFKVDQKVKHKKFGNGTIIKVNQNVKTGTYTYDVMFKFPIGTEFGMPEVKLEAV